MLRFDGGLDRFEVADESPPIGKLKWDVAAITLLGAVDCEIRFLDPHSLEIDVIDSFENALCLSTTYALVRLDEREHHRGSGLFAICLPTWDIGLAKNHRKRHQAESRSRRRRTTSTPRHARVSNHVLIHYFVSAMGSPILASHASLGLAWLGLAWLRDGKGREETLGRGALLDKQIGKG